MGQFQQAFSCIAAERDYPLNLVIIFDYYSGSSPQQQKMDNPSQRHPQAQKTLRQPNFFKEKLIDLQGEKLRNQNKFQKTADSERAKVILNPIIVTRRTISTAKARQEEEDQGEEDLFYTSGCLKMKEDEGKSKQGNLVRHQSEEMKKYGSRPQSKQEPKRQYWNNTPNTESLQLKRKSVHNDRPESSKGQRQKTIKTSKTQTKIDKKIMKKDKNQLADQDFIKELHGKPSSNASVKANKLFYKSGIDSEFLSLFAS